MSPLAVLVTVRLFSIKDFHTKASERRLAYNSKIRLHFKLTKAMTIENNSIQYERVSVVGNYSTHEVSDEIISVFFRY